MHLFSIISPKRLMIPVVVSAAQYHFYSVQTYHSLIGGLDRGSLNRRIRVGGGGLQCLERVRYGNFGCLYEGTVHPMDPKQFAPRRNRSGLIRKYLSSKNLKN